MTDSPTTEPGHDPGGSRFFQLAEGVQGDAAFSPCGQYRHTLLRWRDPGLFGGIGRTALFIGMNPSTATADRDDPTCRREQEYAWREGCTHYAKVNVMDYRATFPATLREPGVTPRSDVNLEWIRQMAYAARADGGFAVAAWGVLHPDLQRYADEARAALIGERVPLFCLGRTKSGAPKHPLYQPADAKLVAFHVRSDA